MKLFCLATLMLAVEFAAPVYGADATVASAKKVLADNQDSIIWISAVAKITLTAEGASDLPNIPDQENKVESTGTIIDENGLVVTALSQVDPSRSVSGREIRYGGNTIRLEAVATIKEVKVTMPDGTDIPAEIVMKDSDLDLAFIRIKTGSKEAKGITFKAVDLKKNGRVEVADEVISLSRMDEVLNRVPLVSRGQVTAMTRKPREFIRVTGSTQGCPTFLPDGRVVGIAVTRTVKNKQPQVVVLPASDILEIAEQARNSQPPAAKQK